MAARQTVLSTLLLLICVFVAFSKKVPPRDKTPASCQSSVRSAIQRIVTIDPENGLEWAIEVLHDQNCMRCMTAEEVSVSQLESCQACLLEYRHVVHRIDGCRACSRAITHEIQWIKQGTSNSSTGASPSTTPSPQTKSAEVPPSIVKGAISCEVCKFSIRYELDMAYAEVEAKTELLMKLIEF